MDTEKVYRQAARKLRRFLDSATDGQIAQALVTSPHRGNLERYQHELDYVVSRIRGITDQLEED